MNKPFSFFSLSNSPLVHPHSPQAGQHWQPLHLWQLGGGGGVDRNLETWRRSRSKLLSKLKTFLVDHQFSLYALLLLVAFQYSLNKSSLWTLTTFKKVEEWSGIQFATSVSANMILTYKYDFSSLLI